MRKMKQPAHLPHELCEQIDYNHETGALTWRTRGAGGKRFVGSPAFASNHSLGYLFGALEGHMYYAHRVAWAMYYGEWPKGEIDHINGNKSDNRILNLREVTKLENHKNKKMPAHNTSGQVGVTWHEPAKKWHVTITVDQEVINGGYFADYADAVGKRKALEFWYGFHHNHGRKRVLKDVL